MSKLLSSRRNVVCMSTLLAATMPLVLAQAQSVQQSGLISAGIVDTNSGVRASSMGRTGMTVAPEDFEKLKLSAGYLLKMDIYDTPEMSRELRIDEHGDITVPLLGSMHLGGDTLPQAEAAIARQLVDQRILVAPQVSLNVIEFAGRNISVLGEVHNPGRIQLLGSKQLGDVLAMAAGETDSAGSDIEIQHHAEDGINSTRHLSYVRGKDAELLQTTFVDPGDTVIVHKSGVVYVLGAVNHPGGYLMLDSGSLNVSQAVTLAGGTSLQAGTNWATVVRPQGNTYTQIRIPLHKIETGNAEQVMLQPNDVLYVPTSGWKSAVINGSSIISAAASASIYAVH